ncbi:hypothetical protein ACFL5S_01940, partial [Fibrobacterota bacterium]
GGSDRHSRIATTIYSSGYYRLVVRAYSTSSYGTVDIYHNGSRIQAGATVAGNVYWCNSGISSGLKNYFTCDPYRSSYRKPDTYLWIMQGRSHTNPIKAWNDDYGQSGGGNYNWGWASRIKSELEDINWMLVSAWSTYNNGVCDLYGGNEQGTTTGYIPYVKIDDAIKSADASDQYNCISWSGGVTREWFWPPDDDNPYHVPGNPLQSFDNYYNNWDPDLQQKVYRHGGTCWDYTRTGATYSDAVIDLWWWKATGSIMHASCRKPVDNYMHGYDWESKIATFNRLFHPRDDIRGGQYGDTAYYYIRSYSAAGSKEMTDAEAIAAGLQVVPPREQFSSEETLKLNRLINSVPAQDRSLFTKYKKALEHEIKNNEELQMHSNPDFYRKTEEYQDLIGHCKNMGDKALPLLFTIINSDDHFIYRAMINDLCRERYGHILREIIDDYVHNGQYTPEGKFIGFSHRNTMIKYAKRILNEKL